MNLRAPMTGLLILGALALFASLAWALLNYIMPRPRWVEIGPVTDYPPSDEPYAIQRSIYVYIVNDGQEIFVLEPLNPASEGVNVRWNQVEQAFIDPKRGSWFNVYGIPYRRLGINSILENQSLRRYQISLENGIISIDLNHATTINLIANQQP